MYVYIYVPSLILRPTNGESLVEVGGTTAD